LHTTCAVRINDADVILSIWLHYGCWVNAKELVAIKKINATKVLLRNKNCTNQQHF